ncbi:hypothetical protein NSK_006424 [Nannochloropsis salina CCMP1776]|uniref:Uncharacterized protein n=1 Tax=Nannochloropsis salina CCMP1776 TaxID=1027361 RepID=A0A4D9CY32_9STRA|nr:hypothetical protein NSK_006424 [Nannochloropsis salina CCMP1776]|eukprot:TFJ82305.1 hypothetical protein NSK_006424 [Nannochloropsis salina CCMP1776]
MQMRFESKKKEKEQEETTSTNNWNGDASAAEAGEKLLRKQAKKLTSVRKNAADLLTQCAKLRLETNDLQKMNQALTSKLEVAKTAQAEASNHATSLESELSVLQKKMGAMGKENQSLLAKLKDIGSSQRTLDMQASVSVLKSKLEAVEKEKQSLQSKIEKAGSSQRKLAEAQKHTAELEAKLTMLESKLEAVEKEKQSLQSKIEKAGSSQRKLAEEQKHTAELEAKLTTLESKLEAVEKEKQSLQSKIEKLQLSFQSGVLADSFGRSHPRQAACVGPRGTLVEAASGHVPARPASTATASRAPAKPEHRSKTAALTRALSAEAQAQTWGEGPQGRGVARRVSHGQAVDMPKETKTGRGSTAASVEDSRRQTDGKGKRDVGSGRRGASLAWSSMTRLLPRGSANPDPPSARQAAPPSSHPPCSATNASFSPLDPGVGGLEGQGARLGCEKGPGGEAGKKEGPAGGARGAGRPDLFPLPRPQSERQGREGEGLLFGLRRSGSSGRHKDGSGPPPEFPEMAPWELYRLVQELTESVREKEEHLELQRDFAKRVAKKLHKLEIKVRKVMDLPLDWDTRGE